MDKAPPGLWPNILSSTIYAAIALVIGYIIAYFPSRIQSEAAMRKAKLEEKVAQEAEDRKKREELRAEFEVEHKRRLDAEKSADEWEAKFHQVEGQLMIREAKCARVGQPCFIILTGKPDKPDQTENKD